MTDSPGSNHESRVEPAIGLALSGGGVRAALFALGVLMYLAVHGLHRNVRLIQSVSGGSIVNASLASAGDIRQMDAHTMAGHCATLASYLANRGAFFLPRLRTVLFVVVGAATAITLLIPGIVLMLRGTWSTDEPLSEQVTWLIVQLIGLWIAIAAAMVLLFRRFAQHTVYERLIREFSAPDRNRPAASTRKRWLLLRPRRTTIDELPESTVLHVLCATELGSGEPIFFSRRWTLSRRYGCSSVALPLATCIYASAAFPGLFPAQPIGIVPDQWSGGVRPGERPSRLVVVDGGVYNNLATELESAMNDMGRNPQALPAEVTAPEIDFELIVNASSPSREEPLPIWWPASSIRRFLRTTTVLYENTLRPRVAALRSDTSRRRVLVDISQSPRGLGKQIMRSKPSVTISARAKASRKALRAKEPTFWDDYVRRSSTFRTTLGAIGCSDAAHIIRHGYLQASVVMHAYLAAPGPERAPEELWFNELVRSGSIPSNARGATLFTDYSATASAEESGLNSEGPR